jgi:hypothetical protein
LEACDPIDFNNFFSPEKLIEFFSTTYLREQASIFYSRSGLKKERQEETSEIEEKQKKKT